MEKIIKEKISSLLSEKEEVLSVEQLGGMTNQNYLVKTTNKQYIVKFFGKGTEKLINRQDEKYNLELLKDLDLDVKKLSFWYWSWYQSKWVYRICDYAWFNVNQDQIW